MDIDLSTINRDNTKINNTGNFSIVYTNCIWNNQQVVVKVLNDIQDLNKDWERECMNLELAHAHGISNIIPILAKGNSPEGKFIVLPQKFTYLEIQQSVNVAPELRWKWFMQIEDAIQNLCDAGIYHNDIHIGNIVFDKEDAFLIDFAFSATKYKKNIYFELCSIAINLGITNDISPLLINVPCDKFVRVSDRVPHPQ